MQPTIGVHDSADSPAFRKYLMDFQRMTRTAWLLTEFGYGTRKDAQVIDTTQHGKPETLELITMPERENAVVVDLGCGPGKGTSTEVILEKLPARKVIGVDPSQDFLDIAARELANYVTAGRLQLHKGYAEHLTTVVQPGSADLVFCMATWMFFDNTRQALEHVQRVLKPGGRFVTYVSSTHYDFEFAESADGPITYDGVIGRQFIRELEAEVQAQLGITIDCHPRLSHQYNNLDTVRTTARSAGLALVKYEEKDWPYEKGVLETKLRNEPKRIMFNDSRIAPLIASGQISAQQRDAIIDATVAKVLASPEYLAHEGRFVERWGAFAFQKPYSAK